MSQRRRTSTTSQSSPTPGSNSQRDRHPDKAPFSHSSEITCTTINRTKSVQSGCHRRYTVHSHTYKAIPYICARAIVQGLDPFSDELQRNGCPNTQGTLLDWHRVFLHCIGVFEAIKEERIDNVVPIYTARHAMQIQIQNPKRGGWRLHSLCTDTSQCTLCSE